MAMLVYEGVKNEVTSECTIGRHRENAVAIRDGGASRKHARVFPADGAWWVEDLKSANGTKHNGKTVEGRVQLRNGDAIRIGESEIMFYCSEREAAPAAGAAPVRLDPASLEGRLISGYRIGESLGRAGMGHVYRARQLSLDRDVAFKVFLRKVVDDDPGFAERFRELASRSGSLQHENFVGLHENGCEDGLVWYSMEFVHGDTLERLVAREGRFTPELGLLVCERIAAAMVAAHAIGIIHRDLSLRSVMLTGEGKVKILDLGIASLLGRGRDRSKPETAWYCSPEVGGKAEPKPGDDTYSLGCIMHHLLAGVAPFSGASAEQVMAAHRDQMIPSLRKAVPALPNKADEVLQQLLNKNRDWRLADMGEAAAALRALREGLGKASAAAQGEAERMVKRSQSQQQRRDAKALRTAITVGVVLVLGLVGYMVLPGLLSQQAPAEPTSPPPVPIAPVAPRPTPVVEQQVLPKQQPTAAADPFAARVKAMRARLATVPSDGWAAVEGELDRLIAEVQAKAPEGPAASELRLLKAQFDGDATEWYRTATSALPRGDGPGDVAARFKALAALRDQAASRDRPDVEARWQQELSGLVQRLNEAKRDARRALESGRPAELQAVAARIAPAFAGTTVEGLSRQFAILCREAAGVQALWNTDWRTTANGFERAKGERAIAAGAALLVVGDVARAKRVLLADPQLAQGELLRRREALLGGLAAVLTFDDPADLQFLDVTAGEPALAGGALAGKAGDAATLACTVPVGGSDWQAEAALVLAADSAEAVLSCAKDGERSVQLRISEGKAAITHGTAAEIAAPLLVKGRHKVRFSCRGGDLAVTLDGRSIATLAKAGIPPGSLFRLELAGSDWRLEDLQVVGGR